jgi:hypothetical protein
MEETFHDVVFVVGDERIGAVRALVAARSDHWERAFYGQCRESTEREVVVGEADPQTFRHLLHFVHTDQLPAAFDLPITYHDQATHDAPYDQVFALWELAERYNVPDLKALLRHRLQELLLVTKPVRLLELVAGDIDDEGMPEELCEQLHDAFGDAFKRNVDLRCLLETLESVLVLGPPLEAHPQRKNVLELARAACVRQVRDKGQELIKLVTDKKQKQQRQWVNASASLVEDVLACLVVQVSDLMVFKALKAWWRHDPDGRTEAVRKMVLARV